MKKYLDETEFKDLQGKLQTGQMRILVERSVARQVFTHVPNRSIQETTGRSMAIQKVTIIVGTVTPILLFVAALIAIVLEFGWGAAALIPLAGIFWTVIAGLTADKGNLIHTAIGLVAGLSLAFLAGGGYAVPLALVTLSLVIQRLSFSLAEYWVTDMVGRSFGAYDMLVEHLYLKEVPTEALPEA